MERRANPRVTKNNNIKKNNETEYIRRPRNHEKEPKNQFQAQSSNHSNNRRIIPNNSGIATNNNQPQISPANNPTPLNQQVVPEYYQPFQRNIDFKICNDKGDRILDRILIKSFAIFERDSGLNFAEENLRFNWRGFIDFLKNNFNFKNNIDDLDIFENDKIENLNFKKKENKNHLEDDEIKRKKEMEAKIKKEKEMKSNPLYKKISELRKKIKSVIETNKMKVKDINWLEDDEFMMELILGFEIFNLKTAGEFEKIGVFNHGLQDNSGISEYGEKAEAVLKKIEEEEMKDLKLDFTSANEFCNSKIYLPPKDGNFIKNFFGGTFYENIKNTKGDKILKEDEIENNNKEEFTLINGYKFSIDDNFDWGFLLNLKEEEILYLVSDKRFYSTFQINWHKIPKVILSRLAIKFLAKMGEMSFVKNQSSFLYLLLRIDFSGLDSSHILFEDYVEGNYLITAEFLENEENYYSDIEEFKAEVLRLKIRNEYIKNILIERFEDDYFYNEISVRTFQKFLKDEIMAKRLSLDEDYFQRINFSCVDFQCFKNPKRNYNVSRILKTHPVDLSKKIIPLNNLLLDYTLEFVNNNFDRFGNSLNMTKTILTLSDFVEIKMVSYRKANYAKKDFIIKRHLEEDQIFLRKFDPILDYIYENPRKFEIKNQINKGITSLITKLEDEQLFRFYFNSLRNLNDMISCRHRNYLLQEVFQRLDNRIKKKMIRGSKKFFDLSIINLPEIKEYIYSKRLRIHKKFKIIKNEMLDEIRDLFLRDFEKVLSQKYSKYVVCFVITEDDELTADTKIPEEVKMRYQNVEEFRIEAVEKFINIEKEK